MKKQLLFIVVLIFSLTTFAQSFNYQAVVRDASDIPIANQSIGVQVTLARAGANIFQETHTVTSNANGLITLAVGTGTATLSTFAVIDWSTQDFIMDIAVDITGGSTYSSLGTTVLRQVPYAMYAASSPSSNFFFKNNMLVTNVDINAPGGTLNDDFVFGSFQLDDNGLNSIFNSRMFYDKSKSAFRAGFTFGDAWNEDKIGDYSVGLGEGGVASGENSFSMGRNANATGAYAIAFGLNAGGFADYARGFGLNARGFGQHSTAIGRQVIANSLAETQLGQYSTYVSGSADTWVSTDRLFVIGNGQEDINLALNSDALVMLKNGNTTLNGTLTIDGDNQGAGTAFTLPAQDGTLNQVMSTDGAGNVSWVSPAAMAIPNGGNNGEVLSTDGTGTLSWISNDILPAGGTSGFVLSTDGTGNYSWITSNDADADATNEIELPTGGNNGQVLATDGSGVYSWVNQPAVGPFTTTSNVTSNSNGDTATDDFVFGSTQLDNVSGAADNSRMFFDKNLSAFRAGNMVDGIGGFDQANLGPYSVGFGQVNRATGWYAATMGINNTSSGWGSLTVGDTNVASGNQSVALGRENTASGASSMTFGSALTAESVVQTTLGILNTSQAGNANAYVATDRLFVIGNGTSNFEGTTRSDALVMLKNGNTTLNGTLTIDGDNAGAGASYTLPTQDGTVNQVMTTDGSGNVVWTDASSGGAALPSGGTNGHILSTDGSGNYSWIIDAVDDADADATNEIELPVGGANGQILSTDGFGNYSWINDATGTTSSFSTTANVTSNANGDATTDDFVFGSTQLANDTNTTNDDNRMYFDKSKGAFRVGRAFSDQWDDSNTERYTISMGNSNVAKGIYSVAIGDRNTANFDTSIALGDRNLLNSANTYALGSNLLAETPLQASFGAYNTSYTSTAPNSFTEPTNRIFVIGNGTSATRSDALVMLRNGNTTLNGQLTIDGDNTGSGTSYTLPAQDGTSNQVMTTDGSGNVAWAVSNGLPSGGTNGQLLGVSAEGVQWLDSSAVILDDSPTNEIELPEQSGQSGKFLTTDGTNPSWTDTVEATSLKILSLPAFNVTSNGTAYTTAGEKEVGDWNNTHNTDLFNDGNHLNLTNGRFTAPVDGLYFFAAQARIDAVNGASGSVYSRLMIVKNGNKQGFRNGLHSIRNADVGTASWDTQHVSGILKLSAGDYVSVLVETTGDTNFTLQVESGFNGYLVNKM